jgi:hypothetical protein
MPDAPPAPRRGLLPWLVGLFALWQLAFVPLTNLLEFVPLRKPDDAGPTVDSTQTWGQFTRFEPAQWSVEFLAGVLAAWGQATGQDQGWNMFTPEFPPNTVVLVTELKFPDGASDRVPSRFAPGPSGARARPPLLHDREFNFEANVFMLAWQWGPGAEQDKKLDLGRQMPETARVNADLLMRYLEWQARRYRAAHPDRPAPSEVVLLLRYIPTPLPGEDTGGPREPVFERPFARWRPGRAPEEGLLPLEGYDPVARRFVPLEGWGRP